MEATRIYLKEKAIKFQETHPGTSFRDALAAVAKPQTTVVPTVRRELRDKAVKFQETHPGTSYKAALAAVAKP